MHPGLFKLLFFDSSKLKKWIFSQNHQTLKKQNASNKSKKNGN